MREIRLWRQHIFKHFKKTILRLESLLDIITIYGSLLWLMATIHVLWLIGVEIAGKCDTKVAFPYCPFPLSLSLSLCTFELPLSAFPHFPLRAKQKRNEHFVRALKSRVFRHWQNSKLPMAN